MKNVVSSKQYKSPTKMPRSRPNMINPYCKQKSRHLLFEWEHRNPCSNHKNSKLSRLLSQNQQQCIHPAISRHTYPPLCQIHVTGESKSINFQFRQKACKEASDMYQQNPAFIDILNQRTIKRARGEGKWVLFMRSGMWNAYINSNVSCNAQKHKAIINLHYRAREFAHNSVKLCFICFVAITGSVRCAVTIRFHMQGF